MTDNPFPAPGDSGRILLSDAVKVIMAKTGCSRRTAKRRILKALQNGSVKATGYRVGPNGEGLGREEIDPAVFAKVKVK